MTGAHISRQGGTTMAIKHPQQLFVMKQDGSMVSGWRLCGTTTSPKQARQIQEAYTTYCNDKPFNVPQIWTEPQYDRWQQESLLT